MTLKVCISTDLQGTFYAWNTIVFKCELYKSYTKDYQGLKNVIISSKLQDRYDKLAEKLEDL